MRIIRLLLIPLICLSTAQLFSQSGLYRSGVFLHHSTGYNYWATGTTNTVPSEIIDYNTAHGYSGSDAVTFNRQGFPAAGDNEWYHWHLLFDSPEGYGGDNIYPIMSANKIVMIKSCFPSSDMSSEGSAADTLTPTTKSTYNYKWHWRNFIRVMSDNPDNFFVVWTNAPLARGATDYTSAQRSHRFSKWAKDTLAAGLDPVFGAFPPNVYVFDIFHKVANDSGYIPYPQYAMSNSDSHPNSAAADLVAPMIVQEVFDASISYEGGMEIPEIPLLEYPGNGSTDQTNYMILRWHPSQGAVSYNLQVSTDSLFGTMIINDSAITDTLSDIGPLANLTTFFWRVRAKNGAGYSGWSEQWKFTTANELQVPAAPALLSPADGSENHPNYVIFRWHTSQNATGYHIQVSADSSFVLPEVNDSALADTFKSTGPLSNNTTYYWRVRGKNLAGISDWSVKWTIITSAQTYLFSYRAGWNMVSVPLTFNDYLTDQIFPTAISEAFEYQGNYVPRDTLKKGTGYWIKFEDMQLVPMAGSPFTAETLMVQTGWNLVGTISDSVGTETVTSLPPGLISSPFYSFNGSYEPVTIFVPGRGYWVKVTESGAIIIMHEP